MFPRTIRPVILGIAILTSVGWTLAQTEREMLLPLTEEELSLAPRDIVAKQPDFVADLTFFRSERVSGGGGSMRVARVGNRYREESEFWIFIGEVGKPAVRLNSKSKTFNDMEPPRDQSANTARPFNPKTLAFEPNVSFNALGAVMIEGQRYVKIEVRRKNQSERIYLYSAPKLNNLIVVAQIHDPPFGFVQRLHNISLDAPNSLVQIPPDYKSIEHDQWTKVETAKVTYKGKPSKNYGVFRAPGGELFVWVKDSIYGWHYLVRLKEATMESTFWGMLYDRSGKFIWLTNETEAFSDTYYRSKERKADERKKENRVDVKPNSVRFLANDFGKNKGMIEVRW